MIGQASVPAQYTEERFLSLTIGFINVTARGTGATRVARINRDHWHTVQLGLVLDKAAQLEERPTRQCCPLWPTSRYPITNPAQFFQGNTATGVFGLGNNALADVVVCPGSKLPFFATQFLQATTRRLRSFGLQLSTQLAVTVTNVLDRLSLKNSAVTIDSNAGNTKIDAKKTVNVRWFRRVNLARLKDVKLSVTVDQIGLALASLKQLVLASTSNKRKFNTATQHPQRNYPLTHLPGEDATIIGNRTMRLERALSFPIKLISIGNLRYKPDGNLGTQAKVLTYSIVDKLMEIVLPKPLLMPGRITHKVSRSVHSHKSMFEQFSLFCSRLQLDLGNQFHGTIIPHMFKYGKQATSWHDSPSGYPSPCL